MNGNIFIDMKQLNEIQRMQQLAGINEIKVINTPNKITKNDLEELKEAIINVYSDWLDISGEEVDVSGDEGGIDSYGWVDLYLFVLRMIYKIDSNLFERLQEKIKFLKNDDGTKMDIGDYIQTYHDDWIEEVEDSIREDISLRLGNDDDEEDY